MRKGREFSLFKDSKKNFFRVLNLETVNPNSNSYSHINVDGFQCIQFVKIDFVNIYTHTSFN